MSYEAPSPDNNLLLRQMAGMRRDMHEMMERQARSIDLQNRLVLRVDEGLTAIRDEFAHLRRDIHLTRSDLIEMENRVLTAISEVRNMAARMDESDASDLSDDDRPRPSPASPAGRHG